MTCISNCVFSSHHCIPFFQSSWSSDYKFSSQTKNCQIKCHCSLVTRQTTRNFVIDSIHFGIKICHSLGTRIILYSCRVIISVCPLCGLFKRSSKATCETLVNVYVYNLLVQISHFQDSCGYCRALYMSMPPCDWFTLIKYTVPPNFICRTTKMPAGQPGKLVVLWATNWNSLQLYTDNGHY